jgi:hypothetical protein
MLASGLVTRLGAEPSAQEPARESRLRVDCVGVATDFVIDLTCRQCEAANQGALPGRGSAVRAGRPRTLCGDFCTAAVPGNKVG